MKKKRTFEIKIILETENEKVMAKQTKVTELDAPVPKDRAEKILDYLREQLAIADEELKSMPGGLSSMDEQSKIEETLAKRTYFRLKSIVKAAERM